MKVKIITGYTPIPGHPRTAEEYGRLGDQLFHGLNCPVKAFYTSLEQCWLYQHIAKQSFEVKHYGGDNPAKNTMAYHIVQHQKAEWLLAGALLDAEADTFVWCDYGAHHVGLTPEKLNDFIRRVVKDDFAIPGCWDDTSQPIEMSYPNWRFCGTMLIVPRQHIATFDAEIKRAAKRLIEKTRRVSWEVNTWARVERISPLPIRWFKADHDASMVDNYAAP